MLIEYHHTNSGGGDWLDVEQWERLEKAGWKLFSYGNFVYNGRNYAYGADGLPEREGKVGRPSCAFKRFETLDKAIGEWEELTGESAYATGCETCGDPHSFYSHDEEGV